MKRKWGRAIAEQVAFGGLVTAGVPTYIAKPLIRATRPRTMPSAGTQTGGGYGQGTYSYRRKQYGGRRISRKSAKYARILANASVQRNVYGLDEFTQFGGTNGSFYLSNWNDTGGPGYRVPLHLWDVTAVPNVVDGTVQTAQSGYKLTFDTVTPSSTLKWMAMGNAMNVRNTGAPSSSSNAYPNASSLLRGIKAKFMFYSSQKIPSKITISLVQILDEKFHPPKTASAGGQLDVGISVANDSLVGSTTDVGTIAFWQQAVQKAAYNPVCINNGNQLKNMRVLKSHSFVLNPKESVDATSATYHQFDFYHKFARRCKYNWQDQKLVTTSLQTEDAVAANWSTNKCSVEPRARMYLMVTGTSLYAAGPAADVTGWPSYDVTIRTYHDDMGA